MRVPLLLVSLALSALLLPLLVVTAQPQWGGSTSPQINPPPIGREGSVYGNDDSEVMVFAGGVNLLQAPSNPSSGATFTTFSDIWSFNISVSTYTQSQSALPTPLYFATGGWSYDVDWLVIYSGRTNTRDHQIANTYFSHAYIVNCYYALRRISGASMSNIAVSTLTLSPVPTPRQHAGSFVQNRYMYVLGGVTGPTGTDIPSDRFFVIELDSGVVRLLPTVATYFPSSSLLTPVLFAPSFTTNYLYVYGGGADALGTALAPTDIVYVYRMDTGQWLPPVRALMEYGPVTPHTAQPSLMYSSITYSRDLSFVSMLGGTRTNGFSHNQAVVLVPGNLTAAPETGTVLVYVEEGEDADQWSTPRERGATGVHLLIDPSKNLWLLDFYIYGGASYAGTNTPVVYSSNTSVWTISGELDEVMPVQSSGSSSLSSGAVAGIVIGVAAFVALVAIGVCYWARVRKSSPSFHVGPQSDDAAIAADSSADSQL